MPYRVSGKSNQNNYVQDPTNTQNFNRYGYVLNNPLKYTDFSGENYNGEGLTSGQQTGLGAAVASLLSSINWKGLRWNDVDEWTTKNIFRPLQSIGDWIGGWFKKRSSKSSSEIATSVNINTSGNGQVYGGDSIIETNSVVRNYGGDGSGSFMDYFHRFVYETDQFNPIALAWDGIQGHFTGVDRYGNSLSGTDSTIKLLSAIPVMTLESSMTNYVTRGGMQYSDDLVRAAQQLYPKKAGLTELHHIAPKYLGGAKNGALVPLDGAYHQVITNEFRILYPYGLPKPSSTEMLDLMRQVYTKYPLPPGY